MGGLVHVLVFVILRLLSPVTHASPPVGPPQNAAPLNQAVPATHAANFVVLNRCSYTVWAAALPGGGSWSLDIEDGTAGARIWGRTNCNFHANGRRSCESGDCKGLLNCNGYGTAPSTLAEYTQSQSMSSTDYIDISLVDGFNIPMDFSPTSGSCPRGIRCAGNSILNQCPAELRAPGGCQNAYEVFNTSVYCCTGGGGGSCGPTTYSDFFKQRCPDAYSYPLDDATSTFSCPSGTNYTVTFCP